jgi:hypothetical protein
LQFSDLARHLLLARGELGGIARYLFLAGHELGGITRYLFLAGHELIDVARYLLLSDEEPVDASPHRFEIERHCVQPLLNGRRGSFRPQAGHIRGAARDWRRRWR